ncbi:GntR family transcriptional regulator [Aestuariispira insulae]|uniref:GntR family transcriptional regulator n=1 Tax=Aestuariispira insulae TaxID=1461337 RepID=A0A3D9H2Q2_9PROT|nr:GntR family transcriptional regulator [Aestuariispira insulae]RED43760.1 GntR family transcriptional regulator [Aestuariispira insulae]
MAKDDSDIYAALLQAIERGEFQPGSRLIETELAERFKVSRTPVREVLNRMESQGIASRDGKGGLIVAELSQDQLGELYDIREVLEGFAARLAARHAAPAEIELLKEMIASGKLVEGEARELAIANKQFHQQLHNCTHNQYLQQMLSSVQRSLALLSGTTLAEPARVVVSEKEHRMLVEAIENRDEDKAEQVARNHVKNAYKTRLKIELGW